MGKAEGGMGSKRREEKARMGADDLTGTFGWPGRNGHGEVDWHGG